MKSPFTGKNMSIYKELRKLKFRKEEFQILSHTYICEETGEKFEDDLFSNLNYNQLLNQYRVKHSIPFPEQIISIRMKYDISAIKMSEILGFGPNTYRQYESGEVPNQSNSRLIQLADDPHEFKKLVDLCNTIDNRFKNRLYHKIDLVLDKQKSYKMVNQLENYLFESCMPNIYTGYKTPSLAKFTEMVVYFTERLEPWKTILNKLLFYADFTMFKYSAYSISGAQYRAIQLGPVPINFDSIFEYIARQDHVEIHYTTFSNGIGEQFKPKSNRMFKPGMFSEKELNILEMSTKMFYKSSAKKVIDISHEESAWKENEKERKIIDYRYAFELRKVDQFSELS